MSKKANKIESIDYTLQITEHKNLYFVICYRNKKQTDFFKKKTDFFLNINTNNFYAFSSRGKHLENDKKRFFYENFFSKSACPLLFL